MAARGGFGTPVVRHGRFFFPRGHLWGFAGIEADEDHLVVAPGVKGKHFQRAHDTLLDLIAKHGATVIDQREQDGLVAEIVAKANLAAGLIPEAKIERQLSIQRRLKAYV